MQTIEPADKWELWNKLDKHRRENPDQWEQSTPTSGWVHKTSMEFFRDVPLPGSARIGPDVTRQSRNSKDDLPVIGDYVAIGRGAMLGRKIVLGIAAAVGAQSMVGNETQIKPGGVIEFQVMVGEKVTIGERANVKSESILYNGVWIGDRSVIEDHVEIAAGATVGPGSRIQSKAKIGVDPKTEKINPDTKPQPDETVIIGECVFIGRGGLVSVNVQIEDEVRTAPDTQIFNETPGNPRLIVGHNTHLEEMAKLATSCEPGCHLDTASVVAPEVLGTLPRACGTFNQGRDYKIAPDGSILLVPIKGYSSADRGSCIVKPRIEARPVPTPHRPSNPRLRNVM